MRSALLLALVFIAGCASAPQSASSLGPDDVLRFLLEHAPRPERNAKCPESAPSWAADETFEIRHGSLTLTVRFDPACPEQAQEPVP